VAVATLLVIGATVLARALHFVLAPESPLNEAIGSVLEVQFALVVVQLAMYYPLSFLSLALVILLWFFRRRGLLDLGPDGWRTRLWFALLLWWQIFLANFVLDLDPRLAIAFAVASAWHGFQVSSAGRRWMASRSRRFRRLHWLVLFLLLAPLPSTAIDRVSLALWVCAQPWLTPVLERAAHWRDRSWPLLLSAMGGQLFAAHTPYLVTNPDLPFVAACFALLRLGYYRGFGPPARWYSKVSLAAMGLLLSLPLGILAGNLLRAESPWPGGTRLGTELAYGLCENAGRRRLAATVPVCTGPAGDRCAQGRIDLYDLDMMTPVTSLQPFRGRFYGRLEQIVCHDEYLLVGMCCATPQGRPNELVVTSIAWTGRVLEESVANRQTHRVLLDSENDTLWLAGLELIHKNLSTGETSVVAARKPPGIFIVESGGKSARRDSVFIGELFQSSLVREFDRSSLSEKAAIDTNGGGVVAVTVDDREGRLYVAGPWGLEILAADSGMRLDSIRLGFSTRTPVIDERNDVVFVPSTTNGKIYVLDREDGAVLGAMSVGFGIRSVFLADEGRWLVANAGHGLWYWDAATVAEHFKR
jgi:hypothetical protein